MVAGPNSTTPKQRQQASEVVGGTFRPKIQTRIGHSIRFAGEWRFCATRLKRATEMRHTLLANQKDAVILIARILMVVLFVLFGWKKLTGFDATVGYMTHADLPLPQVAAAIAVIMELVVGLAIAVGFYTRPLALLLALYTLATAVIGHHYWTMSGAEQYGNMINFYKNVSIAGAFLLLAAVGPGRYSLDKS